MVGSQTFAAGDLIWLDFSPQVGHEQMGRRPALVISATAYNQKVGLAVCCPVTTKSKGYPFEVALPVGVAVRGVVLSDQVKSLDLQARNAETVDRVDEETLAEVRAKIAALLEING